MKKSLKTGLTKAHIKEAVEYVFNQVDKPEERKFRMLRSCKTYGLYDFEKHCGDEECKGCTNSEQEFIKVFKQEAEKYLATLEIISGKVSQIDPDLGRKLFKKYVKK